MNAYIKKYDKRSVVASVTITGNEIEFKVIDTENEPKEVQNKTFLVEDILKDHVTKTTLTTPHNVLLIGGLNKGDPKNYPVLNVLRENLDTKNGTGSLQRKYDLTSYFLIFIPFADSPVSDWVFVASAETFTINGETVTNEIDVDIQRPFGEVCKELLPNLVLTNSNGTISAQITPVKSNVEIYWETTTGLLENARSVTNSSGVAVTTVTNVTSGKVKAGFKYFSGKAELVI